MSYHDKNILSKITAGKATPESILELVSGLSSSLPSTTGSSGGNCAFFGGASLSSGAYIVENPLIGPDPTFPTQLSGVQVATSGDVAALISANLPAGSNFQSSTAKYGDYVYHTFHSGGGGGNFVWGVIKMEINTGTNSLSFIQLYDIVVPTGFSLSGAGLCSKDQDTLILVRDKVIELKLHTNGTVVATELFVVANSMQCTGDVIYKPSDDTIVALVSGGGSYEVHHYDYSGNLIDSSNLSMANAIAGVTMFCYGGDIYFPIGGFWGPTTPSMYRVDLYPLSVTQAATPVNNLHAFTHGDGATSPECCDAVITPPPFDCSDCEVVVLDQVTNAPSGGFTVVHPILGASTTILHPEIPIVGGELAKLGDTIWIKEAQSGTWSWAGETGNYSYHLKEFTINSDCTVNHVRNIPIPYMVSTGSGMCATTLMQGASKQLIMGSGQFPYSYLSTFGPTPSTTYWPQIDNGAAFAMVGIPPLSTPPGTPAHVAPLFNTPGHSVAGDLVYVPSSDTVVASMNATATGNNIILHYALGAPYSPGAVLGLDPNAAFANNPFTMFSYGDDVYVNTATNTYHHNFASAPLTPGALSVSSISISPYDGYNDGASDPNCSLSPPCDLNDAMAVGMQPGGLHHVYDVILGNPGGYFNFLTNMWNHFTGISPGPTGCDWWIDRWTHWSGQLPGLTNPNQILLKTAKIAFAWDMIFICMCNVPSLLASNSPDNTDSYNCIGNGKCAKVNTPDIGRFTSLSACQDNCGDGGWNCQTLEGYQSCYQVSLPSIGAYATLSDCQSGFINGGLGPCKAMESWDDKDEAPPERFVNPLRRPHKNKNY